VRMQVTCSIARDTMLDLGLPPEKVITLPLGVDCRLFRPAAGSEARAAARHRLGVPDNAIAIGCFQKDGQGWGEGNEPKRIKGPDILADALARARRHHPVHAVIPGPSRGYVARRLAELGVPFSAPGFVPRDELAGLYHGLDLYVSPSRDEGGPAGVLEAMASGVAVVSSRAGMPVDIIRPGMNGLLAEAGSAGALATALGDMLADGDCLRAMAARGRTTALEHDWPVVADRYLHELYEPVHGTADR
jgi:glycosyltransferase involved in cell wall biosynthesis